MIRALALALSLAALATCTTTLDTTAAQSPLCDAVMPKLTPWDGNAFDLTSDMTGIHVCDSPKDAGHLWAFVVDGDKVTAKVDIKPELLVQFYQAVIGPSPSQVSAQPLILIKKPLYTTNVVCKGDPGTRPSVRAAAEDELPSIDPDNAPHLIYRTQLLYNAIASAEEDIASGKVCAGK
jgi:hypothetical protein